MALPTRGTGRSRGGCPCSGLETPDADTRKRSLKEWNDRVDKENDEIKKKMRSAPGIHRRADHLVSTFRRQAGILVGVHSVLPGSVKLQHLTFLGQDGMDSLLKAHI